MTALLVAPVLFALLVVVILPFLHGDEETDARLSRVDDALDRFEHGGYGWRNRS